VEVIKESSQENTGVVGVLGMAFGCPFAGEVAITRVMSISDTFIKSGATELTLADTTGMANPAQVIALVSEFKKQFGDETKLGLHFHNTRGLGIANVLAGYQAGVRNFDSSIAGLGGCPFAPEAVGNVCTEDMVNMFDEMGIETHTNLKKLIETSRWSETQIGRNLDGMLMKLKYA